MRKSATFCSLPAVKLSPSPWKDGDPPPPPPFERMPITRHTWRRSAHSSSPGCCNVSVMTPSAISILTCSFMALSSRRPHGADDRTEAGGQPLPDDRLGVADDAIDQFLGGDRRSGQPPCRSSRRRPPCRPRSSPSDSRGCPALDLAAHRCPCPARARKLRSARMTRRVSSSVSYSDQCLLHVGHDSEAMKRVPMFMPRRPSTAVAEAACTSAMPAGSDERYLQFVRRTWQQDHVWDVVLPWDYRIRSLLMLTASASSAFSECRTRLRGSPRAAFQRGDDRSGLRPAGLYDHAAFLDGGDVFRIGRRRETRPRM